MKQVLLFPLHFTRFPAGGMSDAAAPRRIHRQSTAPAIAQEFAAHDGGVYKLAAERSPQVRGARRHACAHARRPGLRTRCTVHTRAHRTQPSAPRTRRFTRSHAPCAAARRGAQCLGRSSVHYYIGRFVTPRQRHTVGHSETCKTRKDAQRGCVAPSWALRGGFIDVHGELHTHLWRDAFLLHRT